MGNPMDRSKRVFSSQTSKFGEAFPQLEDAVFRYDELDFGNKNGSGVFSLGIEGGLLRCRNPRCERGGYEIDQEVYEMLRQGISQKEVHLHCRGDEGTPKGRRRGESCLHSVEGKITLEMKPPAP